MIEKNLAGTYSDEVFTEQNRMLEEKIKSIQFAKNDSIIDKYNLDDITKFVKAKLQDLNNTYLESDLDQKRTLLCSIFPLGIVWSYPGCSNTKNSPFFLGFLDLQQESITFGALDALPFEHLLKWLDELMISLKPDN